MHSYTDRKGRGSASLAMASMILGIVSVALSMTGLSIFIGALAVILALLSRGSGPMLSQAAAGMITGIVAICLEAGILAASLLLMSSEDFELYKEQLQEIYQEYQGESADSPLSSRALSPVAGCSAPLSEWTCDDLFLEEASYALI